MGDLTVLALQIAKVGWFDVHRKGCPQGLINLSLKDMSVSRELSIRWGRMRLTQTKCFFNNAIDDVHSIPFFNSSIVPLRLRYLWQPCTLFLLWGWVIDTQVL